VDIGTVWQWGDNSSGQLGNGGAASGTRTAVMTPTISTVTGIAAGYHHTVALKTDNSVANWGLNAKGELGTNGALKTIENSNVPIQAFAPSAMTAIAAGYQHSVALKNDGTVWTWGYNLLGALGYASINCENPGDFNQPLAWSCSATPTQVTGITGAATAVAAGFDHTLAVASDGTLWSWGRNDTGQLGTTIVNCPDVLMSALTTTMTGFDVTPLTCSTTPVPVFNIPGTITAVTAGTRHSVALTSDGKVWTWGGDHYGQLGITSSPTQTCAITSVFTMPCTATAGELQGLDHVIAISAGSDHTVALKNDGTVWTWGYNGSGQLGNGAALDESPNPTPTQVPGLSGITAIAAGTYHSLALKNDGTVWGWGYNGHGQLGNNTITDSSVPVQVQGLLGPVVVIPGM
jgi:alpha-tubulin suppressor-like RCC1 family protein